MHVAFHLCHKEYVICRNLKKIGYKNETSSKLNAYRKLKEYLILTPLGPVACEGYPDGTYGPCPQRHPSNSHKVAKCYYRVHTPSKMPIIPPLPSLSDWSLSVQQTILVPRDPRVEE